MLVWACAGCRKLDFTSVNYLQWCIGPTAGKPFSFWLQPRMCFPRRIRHWEELSKRNCGFDVCFWLQRGAGHSNTWKKHSPSRIFITHLWGLEEQCIKSWTVSDRETDEGRWKMNVGFCVSITVRCVQVLLGSCGNTNVHSQCVLADDPKRNSYLASRKWFGLRHMMVTPCS